MKSTDPSPRDPFEQLLRRQLGPASLQAPPPHVRALLLARVAAEPPLPERFRLSRALLLRAAALGLLGLAAGWLLVGACRLLGRLSLARQLPADLRGSLAHVLGHGGWLELLRSPLALALLPMLLLPFLYFLQDEGSQG